MRSSCHDPIPPYCTQNVSLQKDMAHIGLLFLSMAPKQMTVCYLWEIIKSEENLDRVSLGVWSGKVRCSNSYSTESTDNLDQVSLMQKGKQRHTKEEKLMEIYKPKAGTLPGRGLHIRRSIIKDYSAAHSILGMEEGKTDLQTSNSKHEEEKWDRRRLSPKEGYFLRDRYQNICHAHKPMSDFFLPFAL